MKEEVVRSIDRTLWENYKASHQPQSQSDIAYYCSYSEQYFNK